MKFLALNDTQLFLMEQWANGNFENNSNFQPYPVNPLDAASVGNCVGLPMCPGIEVTWSMQNPTVYKAPYQILQYQNEAWYFDNGLTPSRDECAGGGCEPGDLTKRMACPWQADFFSVRYNISILPILLSIRKLFQMVQLFTPSYVLLILVATSKPVGCIGGRIDSRRTSC
jgi:hypothetical protein